MSPSTGTISIGLGGSGHEWATCLVSDDSMIAIAEERVTRKKYGLGADLLAAQSRRACLEALGNPSTKEAAVVACDLVPPSFYFPFRSRVEIIDHHLAHAHCAFATSGLERAAILVVDNSGSILSGAKTGTQREVETVSMFQADASGIRLLKRITGVHFIEARTESEFYQAGQTCNSLGHLYRSATLALGLCYSSGAGQGVFSEDGKTMGLSAYGDARFSDALGELLELGPEGEFRADAHAIDRFMARFSANSRFEERAALAASTQLQLERVMLHFAQYLRRTTGLDALCIAGGVALNSVANGVIAKHSGFKHVYVPPAPSDDGIAVGCAVYGQWQLTGSRPQFARSAFLGAPPASEQIDATALGSGLACTRPEDLIDAVATELLRGKIIGWYQGRSEFGPRALGHRSILALPTPGFVRDKLNHEMKRREWFRPYAPMVPEESLAEHFDCSNDSPHMSFVAPVRRPQDMPAAAHVDGTARLQTVSKEDNPRMHALLKKIGAQAGVPVLLNTSFNRAGEPIVETPAEALSSAKAMSLDWLVLDRWLIDLAPAGSG